MSGLLIGFIGQGATQEDIQNRPSPPFVYAVQGRPLESERLRRTRAAVRRVRNVKGALPIEPNLCGETRESRGLACSAGPSPWDGGDAAHPHRTVIYCAAYTVRRRRLTYEYAATGGFISSLTGKYSRSTED